jgi:hypothetical protein
MENWDDSGSSVENIDIYEAKDEYSKLTQSS